MPSKIADAAGALSWWRNQSLDQSSGFFYTLLHITTLIFPHNKLG